MWVFLSIGLICVTILIWSHRYLQPYTPTVEETKVEEKKEPDDEDFIDVMQKIYNKLEE